MSDTRDDGSKVMITYMRDMKDDDSILMTAAPDGDVTAVHIRRGSVTMEPIKRNDWMIYSRNDANIDTIGANTRVNDCNNGPIADTGR